MTTTNSQPIFLISCNYIIILLYQYFVEFCIYVRQSRVWSLINYFKLASKQSSCHKKKTEVKKWWFLFACSHPLATAHATEMIAKNQIHFRNDLISKLFKPFQPIRIIRLENFPKWNFFEMIPFSLLFPKIDSEWTEKFPFSNKYMLVDDWKL